MKEVITMTKSEYIDKINDCKCIPDIQNIARRANRDYKLDVFDAYGVGLAAYNRIMQLKGARA